MSGYTFQKYYILLVEDLFIFTNSVDPDKMQHYAVFYLGLHCILVKGFPRTQRVKLSTVQIQHVKLHVCTSSRMTVKKILGLLNYFLGIFIYLFIFITIYLFIYLFIFF